MGSRSLAERLRAWWRAYHWWVVAGAALLALVLGFVGFREYLGPSSHTNLDVLYLSLQLFVLQSGSIVGPAPWTLEVARLLAPAVGAYALAAVILRVARDELIGLWIRMRRGHVVVCGLEAGWALTRMLRADGERVVVIERNAEHPRIETCRAEQVPVLVGDARDEELLARAGIHRAGRLFVVCGDDAVNMKIAEQARRLSAGRGSAGAAGRRADPLKVLVHVADPDLCSLLTLHEMERPDRAGARLDFFSIYAGGARALLSQYPVLGRSADAGEPPHVVVVGLGRLGRQLVVQAARNWAAEEHAAHERLWITLADEGAEERLAALRQRHPFLDATCRLGAAELPPDPLRLLDAATFAEAGCPPVSNVFVCLPDDAAGLGAALALARSLKGTDVPIVVRAYDADLAALLPSAADPSGGGGLYVFDQMDRTCRPDQFFAGVQEVLAQAIHQAYLHQQHAAGRTAQDRPSIVRWEQLSAELKDANRRQADHIPMKLAAAGCEMAPLTEREAELFTFSPGEVDLLARMEHDRWVSDAAPGHPARVPWDELGEELQDIDRNFIRRMPALLASVGLQVNRWTDGRRDRQPTNPALEPQPARA